MNTDDTINIISEYLNKFKSRKIRVRYRKCSLNEFKSMISVSSKQELTCDKILGKNIISKLPDSLNW